MRLLSLLIIPLAASWACDGGSAVHDAAVADGGQVPRADAACLQQGVLLSIVYENGVPPNACDVSQGTMTLAFDGGTASQSIGTGGAFEFFAPWPSGVSQGELGTLHFYAYSDRSYADGVATLEASPSECVHLSMTVPCCYLCLITFDGGVADGAP